jgi:hypothetical protein
MSDLIRDFLLGLFRPLYNRNYIGKKRHAVLYFIALVPFSIFFIVAVILEPNLSWLWILILLAVISLALVNYFAVDWFSDKVSWRFLWRHFYEPHKEPDELHKAMRNFEKNPTEENKKKVQALIKRKEE